MSATWDAADPPSLPAPSLLGRMMGVARIAAMALATLLAIGPYVVGRTLRRNVSGVFTFHFPIATAWSRLCLRLAGVRPVVVGAPMRHGGILIANHASWLDILALRGRQRINFVSKAEVRNWPGIGWIATVCDTVFIERKRSEALRQQKELLRRVRAGQLLCIFPEGTSTDGRRVLPFKSSLLSVVYEEGVAESAWIQPITLSYRPNPAHGLPENFYGWWGSMPFGGHIWDVVTRSFGGEVEIRFHEARPALDFPDRKALTAYCETEVRGGLAIRGDDAEDSPAA